MFPPPTRGCLRSCARRATAALLVVVQLVVVLSSLTELRYASGEPLPPSVSAPHAAAAISSAGLSQQRAHDEATCPACIARSMHARVETQARLLTALVQQADPVPPSLTSLASSTAPRSNLSRAPPILG